MIGKNLVWIDLEMTGLDPFTDSILEIATVITDAQLNIIAQGPSLAIHHDQQVLSAMNEWCVRVHTKSGLCDKVLASTTSMADAQEQTLAFIAQHCAPQTALLAGNSVWQDKFFMMRQMPEIIKYLNYRLIDVTTIKELVVRWYPNDPQVRFAKSDNHRALEDVLASIDELKHYRQFFFDSARSNASK